MSKIIQKCPTDAKKLLNPETGRCVIETNATIKKLLRQGWTIVITSNENQPEPPLASGVQIFKVCPRDPSLLVNPLTGRCVKHGNPSIKKLLNQGWVIAINQTRTLPAIIKTYGNITNWKKLKSYLDKNKDSIISIDEYLGYRGITETEEKDESENFRGLYDGNNLYKFLSIEILNNRILKKTTCLVNEKFLIGFEPLTSGIPQIDSVTSSQISKLKDYNYIFRSRVAIMFNTPQYSDNIRNITDIDFVIINNLIPMLNSCKNRYLVIPLVITRNNIYEYHHITFGRNRRPVLSHMNVLIFDTINNTIERFDPHGSKFYTDTFLSKDMKKSHIFSRPSYNQERIDNFLRKYFRDTIPSYHYKDILYSCPYLGPQAKVDIRDGYCVTWTIMYTFLRLLNPDIPPGTISRILINDKNENLKTKLLRFAKYYSDLIKFS